MDIRLRIKLGRLWKYPIDRQTIICTVDRRDIPKLQRQMHLLFPTLTFQKIYRESVKPIYVRWPEPVANYAYRNSAREPSLGMCFSVPLETTPWPIKDGEIMTYRLESVRLARTIHPGRFKEPPTFNVESWIDRSARKMRPGWLKESCH
jgi:hypothetical protein